MEKSPGQQAYEARIQAIAESGNLTDIFDGMDLSKHTWGLLDTEAQAYWEKVAQLDKADQQTASPQDAWIHNLLRSNEGK